MEQHIPWWKSIVLLAHTQYVFYSYVLFSIVMSTFSKMLIGTRNNLLGKLMSMLLNAKFLNLCMARVQLYTAFVQ